MGIIQEMLTQDHEKKQTIDRKVSEQHIMPTQGEQQKANDVIRIISEKYAEKLKNHSIQDIEDELIEAIRKECEGLDLTYEEQKRIEKTVIITALGQGPIEEYLRDPNITEIVVQRFDNVVIERNGKIESVKAVFFNEEHLVNTIERIVQSADRQINQSVPIADAKLADGSRVNAKMESEDDAIITDPKKAVYTLNSLCTEMDNRLELCKKAGARNIAEYNEKFTSRRLNPMNGHRYLPYIVVVVDEFADLIMTAREVEGPVMRLAQKARAIGIHLIIATQRPDVKVITGGIKANFPARIAFRVMQMIDSRTIIDQPGANQLIGRGDMLFSKDGDLTRIQCALVETREVERICEYISKQQGYTEAYTLPDYTPDGGDAQMGSEESSAPVKYDSLFAEIARDAVSGGQISTSMIQRNYEVGFNRAGRIMMQLERAGIVGRQQGAKPRDILYHDLPSLEAKLQELGLF